ncbi:MAG: signal peptidase I [Coriobacteriia bacterium]|nr:signal peptidase I [Coriobacteriia bacterium]
MSRPRPKIKLPEVQPQSEPEHALGLEPFPDDGSSNIVAPDASPESDEEFFSSIDSEANPGSGDESFQNSIFEVEPEQDDGALQANLESDEEFFSRITPELNLELGEESALDRIFESEPLAQPKPNGPASLSFLRFVIEFALVLLLASGLTWLVKNFVIQPFEIPSGSMETTLLIGDKIMAEKVTYLFNPIERGEIVVFDDMTQPNRILVKRVIALAGDVVDLRDGRVYLNGKPLYEPYTRGMRSEERPVHFQDIPISYPFTVPEGYIWVMGDNRTISSDSRYFGPVPVDTVKGRVVMIFWPPKDIRFMGSSSS